MFLQKITGLSESQLFLHTNPLSVLDEAGRKKMFDFSQCFQQGEPLEYILEEAEFYGRKFFVDSRVLIPRNDTEVMVDEVLHVFSGAQVWANLCARPEIFLIDIGTGSGCIPISVLKEVYDVGNEAYDVGNENIRSLLRTIAIDISSDALEVAKKNAKLCGVEDKIQFFEWNLLEPILSNPEATLFTKEKNWSERQVIITANLPYIKNADYDNMSPETVHYEPDLALYWWEKTGFELYEKLIKQCLHLLPLLEGVGGSIVLFIEIGFDQKQICVDFLWQKWLGYEIFKDNGGLERCVKIKI